MAVEAGYVWINEFGKHFLGAWDGKPFDVIAVDVPVGPRGADVEAVAVREPDHGGHAEVVAQANLRRRARP